MHVVLAALLLGSPTVDAPARQREDHALVFLCDSKPVAIAAILRDYEGSAKPRISLTSKTTAPSLVEFESDQVSGSVRLISEALATQQLAPAIRASWQWTNAGPTLRAQKGYLDIVVRSRRGDVLDHNLALTQLVASAVKAAHGCGVFWGNASFVIEPKRFLATSAKATRSHLPVLLWINVLPAKLSATTPVFHTIGLSSLELPELILEKGEASDEASLDMILRMSDLVLRNGQGLRDGETVNLTAREALRATSMPAPWDPKETAIRLTASSRHR